MDHLHLFMIFTTGKHANKCRSFRIVFDLILLQRDEKRWEIRQQITVVTAGKALG